MNTRALTATDLYSQLVNGRPSVTVQMPWFRVGIAKCEAGWWLVREGAIELMTVEEYPNFVEASAAMDAILDLELDKKDN